VYFLEEEEGAGVLSRERGRVHWRRRVGVFKKTDILQNTYTKLQCVRYLEKPRGFWCGA
jgi:hypothetical protein